MRPFSDVGGRHVVRLDNSIPARQAPATRLQTAGCAVDLKGQDWHTPPATSRVPQRWATDCPLVGECHPRRPPGRRSTSFGSARPRAKWTCLRSKPRPASCRRAGAARRRCREALENARRWPLYYDPASRILDFEHYEGEHRSHLIWAAFVDACAAADIDRTRSQPRRPCSTW